MRCTWRMNVASVIRPPRLLLIKVLPVSVHLVQWWGRWWWWWRMWHPETAAKAVFTFVVSPISCLWVWRVPPAISATSSPQAVHVSVIGRSMWKKTDSVCHSELSSPLTLDCNLVRFDFALIDLSQSTFTAACDQQVVQQSTAIYRQTNP